jgi:hypothetical protein
METTNATPSIDRRHKSFWVPLEDEYGNEETAQNSTQASQNSAEPVKNSEQASQNSAEVPAPPPAQKQRPELSVKTFRITEVSNTSIFVVLIDSIPKFYCQSLNDAIRKARNFLQINRKHLDRKYFIDNLPNGEIHLTSVNKFLLFQNESLEHVAKICEIPQVKFMVQ